MNREPLILSISAWTAPATVEISSGVGTVTVSRVRAAGGVSPRQPVGAPDPESLDA